MGFHENLTDRQTCASIEYLYWHDELEDCLKKLHKRYRLEMPSYEKNQVFYSTHRDTIDLQTIAESISVTVVGVDASESSNVPSDQLLARWRINLNTRKFLPIINEEKESLTKKALCDSANRTGLTLSPHRASLRCQSGRENSTPLTLEPKRKPRPRNKFSPRIELTRTPKASNKVCTSKDSILATPVAKASHMKSVSGKPSSRAKNWTGVAFKVTHSKEMIFSSFTELAAGKCLSPVTPNKAIGTTLNEDRTPEIKSGGGLEKDGSACKRRLDLDTSDILDMVCEDDEDDDCIVGDDEEDCMVTRESDKDDVTRDILTSDVGIEKSRSKNKSSKEKKKKGEVEKKGR